MPDDKEVERLAQDAFNRSSLACQRCGGAGWYQGSRADHDPNCDGSCRYCPVEVPVQEQCDCIPIEEAIKSAIRSAMRIGEKRAYEDAVKHSESEAQHHQGSTSAYDCGAHRAYKNEARWLQAKADSLKGE